MSLFKHFEFMKEIGAMNVRLARHPVASWVVLYVYEGVLCESYGSTEVAAFEAAVERICGPMEPPTCRICDGLGHGYPSAGPCPLENMGEPMDEREEYLLGLEEDRMRDACSADAGRSLS